MALRSRCDALLYGWLAGAVLYAFVTVTVERVDYYLYPFLPLGALTGAGFLVSLWGRWEGSPERVRKGVCVAAGIALAVVIANNETQIRPYYAYSRTATQPPSSSTQRLEPGVLRRDGALRPLDPLRHQSEGMAGGPVSLDSVRRAERDSQGSALLHRDREQPLAAQRGLGRVAQCFPLRGAPGRGRCTKPT